MTSRRSRFKLALLTGALLTLGPTLAVHAQTQPFPNRPIRLVVPHAAGGNSDAFARIISQKLSERLGQPVVVENRTGAGGTLALGQIARSTPADGYTLAVADTGTHSIAPTLYGSRLQYNVFKDFTFIAHGADFSTLLLLHPSVPANTPQEFIALAKSQPGKLNYASAGTGNGSHLAQDLFRYAAGGLDMQHIPYKGGAPAVQALIAGEVQMTAVSVNTSLPHVRSGRAKALAIASSKRTPALPDVPTLAESGIQGAEADNWLGIVGPAGIPQPIVERLYKEIAATLETPEIKEKLASIGLIAVGQDGASFRPFLERDEKKWGDVVKRSGASAE